MVDKSSSFTLLNLFAADPPHFTFNHRPVSEIGLQVHRSGQVAAATESVGGTTVA